jgi:methionyl-tRNA formyltransferase
MGTPQFSAECLKKIILTGFKPILVITPPDRKKGRGQKLSSPPVKDVAVANKIETLQTDNINKSEIIAKLKKLNLDLIVVVSFGQLLSENFIKISSLGCVNLHFSLLPKYRGAAPIRWAIINGETKIGVTTFFIEKEMDAGDIIKQKEIVLDTKNNYQSLSEKMLKEGSNLIIETIKDIKEKNISPLPQDHSKATYAPKITSQNLLIDWHSKALDIYNQTRAFDPKPGAYTFINIEGEKKRLKIFYTILKPNNKTFCNAKPGEIIDINEEAISVKTSDGIICILEIQTEGGKRLSAADFIHGHKIEKGTILG